VAGGSVPPLRFSSHPPFPGASADPATTFFLGPPEFPGMEPKPGAPLPPEAAMADAVVEEVTRTSMPEKRKLAVDHRMVINEVQLMLAEKRTSFALLRTGVSVALVPLSLWTVLVATSRLWNPFAVLWLLVPVMVVAMGLFLLGLYLIVHALRHLRHVERVLMGLRQRDTLLEGLLYKEVGRHRLTKLRRLARRGGRGTA
jgi:uncharacterized membrane protein YidH (DUF202 family)